MSEPIRDPAIQGCVESCARLLQVLQAVSPDQYRATWKGHNGIGPHIRHCYEHLSALREGLDTGTIAYDARERNAALEQDPRACAAAIEDAAHWLETLDPNKLDLPLLSCQIPHVDAAPAFSKSSLRRELLFVTSHTIHHLAVVSILAELHGIALPGRLGLAYSTQAYERAQVAAETSGATAAP